MAIEENKEIQRRRSDVPSGVYERDPERLCKGDPSNPCQNYPLKGQTVCRFHGGSSAVALHAAAARLAQQEVTTAATQAGMSVPTTLTAKDFGPVIVEYVTRLNVLYADLTSSVYEHRADMEGVAWAREYGDILDRLAVTQRLVAQMMTAAGALGIRVEENPDDDPSVTGTAKLLAALDDLREQRDQTMLPCHTCSGQGYLPRWDFATGDLI